MCGFRVSDLWVWVVSYFAVVLGFHGIEGIKQEPGGGIRSDLGLQNWPVGPSPGALRTHSALFGNWLG